LKEETAKYFSTAKKLLKKAAEFVSLGYYEDAGRDCYLAGMNAVRGLLFEDNFKLNKRHKTLYGALATALHKRGVHDIKLTSFLPTMANMKAIADYETGDDKITKGMAEKAIETAIDFVSAIKKIAAAPLAAPHNGKHKKSTSPR
jgi:uncharacterized protein (UPF0332 family)